MKERKIYIDEHLKCVMISGMRFDDWNRNVGYLKCCAMFDFSYAGSFYQTRAPIEDRFGI